MTQKQWDKHAGHMEDHIEWPASKEEIVAACAGEDVDPEVLEDLKMNLPERGYKNAAEVKKVMVKM